MHISGFIIYSLSIIHLLCLIVTSLMMNTYVIVFALTMNEWFHRDWGLWGLFYDLSYDMLLSITRILAKLIL